MRFLASITLITIILVVLIYKNDVWLPVVTDFINHKTNTDQDLANDPQYQLYTKYKNAKYSEPFEQCYVQCASGGFDAFKVCIGANSCSYINQ